MSPPMKKFLRAYFLLLLIFVLALVLRTYKLGSIPYGLHEDEVMNGYVGRYILQNGKDLYGNKWPVLYFDNFGDYPNVIPMYLSGLSTYAFGLNAFAIRFPIALVGALTVIPVYLLCRQVFLQKKYALFASCSLAILPWHIMLSRSTAENITATFVYLFALYFLFLFIRYKKKSNLLLATLLGLSTYFLYPSYRVITPLAFLATSAFFFRQKKKIIPLFIVGIGFLVLTFFVGRTVWGQGRFHQTSLFYFNGTVAHRLQTYAFGLGDGHTLEARIFYNKLVGFAREFARQFLSYLSPNFLFTDAGKPDRYRLSDTGLMYISFLAICIAGIGARLFSAENKKVNDVFTPDGKNYFLLLITFLALSIVPAALTLDDIPNIHRSLSLGVFALFFVTYCLTQISILGKIKKLLYIGIALALTFESMYFWHQWIAFSPTDQAPFRDQGRVALAEHLVAHHTEYETVYLSKNAKVLYYLLSGNNFDPTLAGKFGFNILIPQVDNLKYLEADCVTGVDNVPLTTKSLVVEVANCPDSQKYPLEKKNSIMRKDSLPAFYLYTLVLPTTK